MEFTDQELIELWRRMTLLKTQLCGYCFQGKDKNYYFCTKFKHFDEFPDRIVHYDGIAEIEHIVKIS